jgi:biotin operon repressor
MLPKPVFTDPDLAQEFLDRMYGPDATVCFQVFGERPGHDVAPEWRYGTFKEMRTWLCNRNQAGAGVYFMVNQGDGKGRSATNVTKVTHLFVDLDGAPHEPLTALGCTPHIITQSSPGRYQAFWRVDDCPLDDFRTYQKALAKKFNGDPAVNDPSRVMRLPGFSHQKRTPFKSEVFKYHDLQPWKPALIKSLLHLEMNGSTPSASVQPAHDPFSEEPFKTGERHARMLSAVARLRNSALKGEALFNAAWQINVDRCQPPLGETEIRRMVKWGNNLIENPIVSAPVALLNDVFHPSIVDVATIYAEPFEPIHWVVEDLLPTGLTVLAGDPKSGKSYLTQHICIAVASGTKAMGRFGVSQGDVLTLSLEDSKNRFKQRLHSLLAGADPPERAFFARKWSRMPEAIKHIRAWVKSANKPQLVVIDTLAKLRGRPKRWDSSGIYERDYDDVSSIQEMAQDHQIAVIVVHHTNKSEQSDDFRRISGSQGITGASDSNWVMTTDRERMEATLIMAGREIPDMRYWLKMERESGIWKCMGTVSDMRRKQGEVQIIEALQEIGQPSSQQEIAKYIGIAKQTVNHSIKGLLADGIVERSVTGKYILAPSLR